MTALTDRPWSPGQEGGPEAPPSFDECLIEILLVHPGGPFWANKDEHGWSIPKGEFDPNVEDSESAARREFHEELGTPAPSEQARPIPPFRAGRKTIHPWVIAADFDSSTVNSNEIELEWPPRSGRFISVPEVDKAQWFTLDQARTKLHKGQAPIVDLIIDALKPGWDHRERDIQP
jgi:predicted NUDIX family NTP pyrophosphohydrolase